MLFPLGSPPSAAPRVVVTGAGIVTGYGRGWAANGPGFQSGRSAFRPVTLFDTSKQRVRTAAEAALGRELPPNRLSRRQQSRLDRADRLLLWAAHEAFAQSGWVAGERIPFLVGTTAGGMALGEQYHRRALQSPGCRRGQLTRAVHYQSQTQGVLVAAALGLGGEVRVLSNACASGANAIGEAWECLRRGQAQRVLAGGYDALCQLVFCGFDSLLALSPTVCRPFDAGRDGLALGEGAGVLALETLDSARRRNAVILGELSGYGVSVDLHHLTQPHPDGNAALAAMSQACQSAGVSPAEIDYVNAHGTGTPLNDSAEARALARWAGERARTLPVSSTKAGIGHLLGAAGAVEAVVCLMALQGQWLPPEPVLERPDPACTFPIVREPREAKLNTVLSNSFGFGGVNATLIFRRMG